jgi:hypothetical protein
LIERGPKPTDDVRPVNLLHNIQLFVDKTVAYTALLFEAIAFTLRKLPNCTNRDSKSRKPASGVFVSV